MAIGGCHLTPGPPPCRLTAMRPISPYLVPIAEIITNRTLWWEGLVDPEAKQTNGALASVSYDEFCCLGIAAEKVPALCLTHRRTEFFPEGNGYTFEVPDDLSDLVSSEERAIIADADLPWPVLPRLGLTSEMQTFLISLNDNARMNFQQIAEVIKVLPIVGSVEQPDNTWDKYLFLRDNQELFYEASQNWVFEQFRDLINYAGEQAYQANLARKQLDAVSGLTNG